MDHPSKEGGLFVSDLYLKKSCLKYLDISKKNIIFVLKLKKKFPIETD